MGLASARVGERFGQAVRRLREARGRSQERLAHRAGLGRSYPGEVGRATVMPALATAAGPAGVLEVSSSQLVADREAAGATTILP